MIDADTCCATTCSCSSERQNDQCFDWRHETCLLTGFLLVNSRAIGWLRMGCLAIARIC